MGKWGNYNGGLLHIALFFSFVQVSWSRGSWDGVMVTREDYEALSRVKSELIDFRGVLTSWSNGSGIAGACSGRWAGIKCVRGQVIAINLPWKGLGGRISEKIGELQALRKLSLHDNVIGGSIPAAIGLLPNLRGLHLFNNRISGRVPPSLGRSPVLQTLDLSNNQLSGNLPPSLGNPTRLFRLNLSFNYLSGSIPVSLSQSPSLVFLSLHHNNLSGPIPDTWGAGNKTLLVLDLSNNAINGSFPSSFTKLAALTTLNLGSNKIAGGIPESIRNISGLAVLDLSKNEFSGEIPKSIPSLPNLTSLNVSYNLLSGPVPFLLSKKYNSSAFVGNPNLCGYSPSAPCPSPPAAPPLSQAPSSSFPTSRGHRKLSTKDIILIAAGVLSILLLILCCTLLVCLIKKKVSGGGGKEAPAAAAGGGAATGKAAGGGEKEGGAGETGGGGKLVHFDGPLAFTADDLLCATAEIMGKSTYGTAYKATLEDGNQVAVKRLRERITKGQREFEQEVCELGKIRDPYILALRAYYLGPKGEKLLVYDYMSNGSLSSFLHARGPETGIDWATRMSIAMGITRGLCFLHSKENNNNNIVHGNLTSTNILLDDSNHPRIGDVGLSRLMTSAGNANVVATAAASGYRAPEFSKLKNASAKTDVYSLGVILLELLTGRSPGEATAAGGTDLPAWVASIVKEEWTNEVFDVELMRDAPAAGEEMLETLKLALHCVDPSPAARPEARQVLEKLEEIKPELAAAAQAAASPSPVPEKTEE
ncbi:unnamed protein product [Cuscuta campestris]|uniref:Protein kinase domain-containing protein n=1 Tax=Cuscuta campestris TaxID=132261 RepID=A0A484L4C1_9ASTE|nr:unnamed protein product [Cuscuta campestris]